MNIYKIKLRLHSNISECRIFYYNSRNISSDENKVIVKYLIKYNEIENTGGLNVWRDMIARGVSVNIRITTFNNQRDGIMKFSFYST